MPILSITSNRTTFSTVFPPFGQAAVTPRSAVGVDSLLAEAAETLARGSSPASLAIQRSPEGAIPTISRHHISRSSDSVHSTTSTTGPPSPTPICYPAHALRKRDFDCGGSAPFRLPYNCARASGSVMPTRRQFRGQQLTTIVVALHIQPLTAPAVGCGGSENRLVVGLEELVAARSVRERYPVSLHHATTVSDAKPSRRQGVSISRLLSSAVAPSLRGAMTECSSRRRIHSISHAYTVDFIYHLDQINSRSRREMIR